MQIVAAFAVLGFQFLNIPLTNICIYGYRFVRVTKLAKSSLKDETFSHWCKKPFSALRVTLSHPIFPLQSCTYYLTQHALIPFSDRYFITRLVLLSRLSH